MGKTGGIYLNPRTFFSETYTKLDFTAEEFWNAEKKDWGRIVHVFEHSSISFIKRNGAKVKIQCDKKILLSVDGLLSTALPDKIKSDDEALIVLSNHISTFLAILNMGGIFFMPTSEKEIVHIELSENTISQVSGGGDLYSVNRMDSAMLRYRIPYLYGSQIIDSNWVALRIVNKHEIESCHKLGHQIISKLNIQSSEAILFLEAYHNYTLHKWNNALLLGWAFIEILIEKLWKEKILSNTSADELSRKDRLNDPRTYSASLKTEFLYSTNQLTKDLYNKLNQLRSIRNKLIHEGSFITQPEVENIYDSTKQLIVILTSIEPKFYNPGWSRAGGWTS